MVRVSSCQNILKYRIVIDYGTASVVEVKYNKISQLGILNGDRLRLIEVKLTVNKGTAFWEFGKCPFNRG